MSFISENTAYIFFNVPYYKAKDEIKWDSDKYGENTMGTSLDLKYIKNKEIENYVLSISTLGKKFVTTREKIKKYLFDTPNSLTKKFDKEVVIVPLSLFKEDEKEHVINLE